MKKRKICVVTGTRAEYGLLAGIMKEILDDRELQLQVVATGMHLSTEFGLTYKEIERDGFHIDERVEMLLSSDTPVGVAKSIGLGTIGFADVLARLQPDIVLLLGDRFEALAAAQAALVAKIPLAHIHGGEITEGAVDDEIRHAITKMAQIHFVSAPEHKKCVIQLGESPSMVFEVGAPGMDYIMKMKYWSLNQLENDLNFRLGNKFFLITYHPETLKEEGIDDEIGELLSALDFFPDYKLLFTKANSDAGGRDINQRIDEYASKNTARVYCTMSLGRERYLNAMNLCTAVIGNSSSGLFEAPVLRKPVVNIGNRQKNRFRFGFVTDCQTERQSIQDAICSVLRPDVGKYLSQVHIAHADGKVSCHIKNILKNFDLAGICQKKFYDLK